MTTKKKEKKENNLKNKLNTEYSGEQFVNMFNELKEKTKDFLQAYIPTKAGKSSVLNLFVLFIKNNELITDADLEMYLPTLRGNIKERGRAKTTISYKRYGGLMKREKKVRDDNKTFLYPGDNKIKYRKGFVNMKPKDGTEFLTEIGKYYKNPGEVAKDMVSTEPYAKNWEEWKSDPYKYDIEGGFDDGKDIYNFHALFELVGDWNKKMGTTQKGKEYRVRLTQGRGKKKRRRSKRAIQKDFSANIANAFDAGAISVTNANKILNELKKV